MTPVWNETDMNAQRGFFHFHPGPGAQIDPNPWTIENYLLFLKPEVPLL